MSEAKILLADDDEELCQLLRDFLVRDGFAVDVSHDGDEALCRARDGGFDAVVLDVMLPQRSGLDLLRELRRDNALPVLMLTALGEDTDRILGLELGADDYVPKPCNPREIAARLRAILRRTRGDADATRLADVSVGPVALRAASRSVTLRGEPVALTGTEFNVLAALLREAGRVVSKETLSQDVLGRPLGPFDRSIDVHISKLRRKLGDAADGESLIGTVHRGGYVFRIVDEG
ncbi:MAG: response regulator transcription factor [Xanthomonadaceae bacterium]|nr:response regulator transcription factor [Xanthomonadaceae bacterium]MDE2258135.1 response regulator transcription factor [Xanthomonadaceae bacterium]